MAHAVERTRPTPARSRAGTLTGTWSLVRLALRVDRIRLPLWIGALTLVVVVTASSFAGLYPDVASREQFAAGLGSNPALLALYGPMHAPDQIGGLTVWRQGVIQLVLVSLMSVFVVVRHTRAAEETGRLELIGSATVGRHAPLAAALATAALADLTLGTVVAVGLTAVGEAVAGSVAFGAALAATGLAFAAIAAITAQVTDDARVANGLAGTGLGLAFTIRAAGDAATGQTLGWLSWVSPLGWAQAVRPYADERWWVLGLLVALAVLGVVVAAGLRARRDLGAGLVPPRPGPARAAPGLAHPVGLAWRLQRPALRFWLVGMLVLGTVFGGVVDAITQLFEDTPLLADILERLGGTRRAVDAFLGAILGVFGVLVSVHAIGAVLELRTEETRRRAELVLATAVTRWAWGASHLLFALVGPVVLLAAAGGAAGLASGLVIGAGPGDTVRLALAALVQLPAVWVVAGIAVALVGLAPRWSSAAYAALGAFLLLGQVGEALQLDQRWLDLSPFAHLPPLPGAAMTWAPVLWLTGLAVGLCGIGLLGLRRRDLTD